MNTSTRSSSGAAALPSDARDEPSDRLRAPTAPGSSTARLTLERSERRAWYVAIAGLLLGLIGIAAVFVQGPLRRVVEIPIVVDRVTGEATIQQRLSVETIPPLEALDKHNLATFVRAREAYSWMFLQRDFDQVARMAVPAVFADYSRQFEGEAALQKRIAGAEDWRIDIVGVRLAAIGPPRQPRRSHRHLRQGRPPHRPQPARHDDAARRQHRLPVPAQGAGQGARPAREPVRLRRHGLPLRPRDQHAASGSRSHEARMLVHAGARCLAGADACAARRAAEPPIRACATSSTTRRRSSRVPVKRGVVTLHPARRRRGHHRCRLRPGRRLHASPSSVVHRRAGRGTHIFVKPKSTASAPNNLAVVTDQRTHAFRFVVLPDGDHGQPVYRSSVKAPVVLTVASAPAGAVASLRRARPPPEPLRPRSWSPNVCSAAPRSSNSSYSIAEGKASEDIVPTLVFDDGRFTYLRFPGNREVPAVFHVLGDGSETLVNTRMEGDLLVVDRVSRRLMLRAGSAVVGVWNEAFDLDGVPPARGTTVPGVAAACSSGRLRRVRNAHGDSTMNDARRPPRLGRRRARTTTDQPLCRARPASRASRSAEA